MGFKARFDPSQPFSLLLVGLSMVKMLFFSVGEVLPVYIGERQSPTISQYSCAAAGVTSSMYITNNTGF